MSEIIILAIRIPYLLDPSDNWEKSVLKKRKTLLPAKVEYPESSPRSRLAVTECQLSHSLLQTIWTFIIPLCESSRSIVMSFAV